MTMATLIGIVTADQDIESFLPNYQPLLSDWPYLIIVIFFTLTQFLENKIYTEKRQFFALNL